MAPTRNYPMCKNSRRYNRTQNFGLYGHAESKKTQKFVFRSALRPNQISFSHDQDPFRKSAVGHAQSAAVRIRRSARPKSSHLVGGAFQKSHQ